MSIRQDLISVIKSIQFTDPLLLYTKRSIEAITEADLEYMGVKRGHRRVLQRALVTLRRSSDPSLAHVEPGKRILTFLSSKPPQIESWPYSLIPLAYSMTPMIEPHTPPPSASDSPHDAINNPRSVSIQPSQLISYPHFPKFAYGSQPLIPSRSSSRSSQKVYAALLGFDLSSTQPTTSLDARLFLACPHSDQTPPLSFLSFTHNPTSV